MSIGEYYKLLQAGIRPTRQRTVKEEQKKPTLSPAQQHVPLKIKKEKPQTPQAQQIQPHHHTAPKQLEKSAESPTKITRQSAVEAKHKMKLNEKIQQQKDKERERKQANNITVMKQSLIVGGKGDGDGVGHTRVVRSSTAASSAQIKQHSALERKKKPSNEFAQKSNEDEDSDLKERAKDDKKIINKFELVDPHPFYCDNRYAFENDIDKPILYQINKIDYNDTGDQIQYLLSNDQSIDQSKIAFVSRFYCAKLSLFEKNDHIQKFIKDSQQDIQIIVSQKIVPSAFDPLKPQFVTLIPSNVKNQFIAFEVKLKDNQNPYKDIIKEYDQQQFLQDQQKYYNQQEINLQQVLELAEKLNNVYNDYIKRTKSILVTQENMEDLLYSIVSYESIDNNVGEKPSIKQKLGIFLRIKYDPYYQDYLLFIRQLHVKNNQKERTKWLELSKFRVKSDLSRGFVSLEQIQTFENANNSQQKLKLRNIFMVSYNESQVQRKALRKISHLKNDHKEEEPRMANIHKDSTISNDRCCQCNYIAQGIEHLKCTNCEKVYHEQCLKSPILAYLGLREQNWHCPDCIRCTNCLSNKNKNQLLICKHCNSGFHYDCLDQSVRLSIPGLILQSDKNDSAAKNTENKKGLLESEFKCDRCIECQHCGAKEAGKNRLNKWSKDFKLCSNCNKKRKNKQYCLICERFWPDNLASDEQAMEEFKKDYLTKQMINCGQCGMWVHLDCDRMFQNSELKQKFADQKLIYHCQQCRQQIRTQLIAQLVDRICNEDRYYFFQEPVEEHVHNYTKIVKNPMCFKYIKQKIQIYLRNPEQLKTDCALVFSNATLFNLPRHKVHKEALRLSEICTQLIQSVWSTLEKNKLRTLDEESYGQCMKTQANVEKKGQAIENKEDDVQMPQYFMKIEDLFEISEHQPIQQKIYIENDHELSDFNDNEESVEFNDPAVTPGGTANISAGIVKNLRTRKNINYNEDRMLGGAGPASLQNDLSQISGQKRLKTSSSFFVDPDESFNFGSRGKRQKLYQNESTNYQPLKGTNLLQQAINQQAKLEEQLAAQSETQSNANPEVSQTNHIQQQQQMMMNYYQEIDDEKCYYSNPARCSFDDPTLIFEEMCYLCGSFGNREEFLSCTLCGESFHTYCLQLPSDQISKYQSYWKCLNCKFCEICASASQEAFLLYCDVCDKAFHSFCLTPQLKNIPNCQWKCQECFSCIRCGTKKFFSEEEASQKKNLEVTDFEFSQNFSFCYSCGVNEYKKSFCKICQKKSDDQAQEVPKKRGQVQLKQQKEKVVSDMMKCNTCGFYSHLRCSRLLPDQQFDQNDYKCLECLLAGKTINHLIRETCEHYENIHQIISRQKLLASLCTDILNKYFPIPDKAPLFIKSFIDQNADFFRNDQIVQDWLELLETNVCFETDDATTAVQDQGDADMKEDDDSEESKESRVKEEKKEQPNSKQQQEAVSTNKDEKKNKLMERINMREIEREIKAGEDFESFDQKMNGAQKEGDLSKVYYQQKFDEDRIVHNTSTNNLSGDQINHIIAQSSTIVAQNPQIQQIPEKTWQGFTLSDVFDPYQPQPKDQQLSKAQQLQKQMFVHKETFLPQKRNLYESLYYGDLHRHAQREHFIQPNELAKMITVPTEENLREIRYSELLVKAEFKAVMRIKLQFFKWFEDLIKNILKNNQKYLKKEQKKQSQQKEEDVSMINTDAIPASNDIDNFKNHQSAISLDDEILLQEDLLIQNPQQKLQCVLCKQNGEFTVTGRLIPFQVNQFVHVNCALWSTDVCEIGDGQLINFFFVYSGRPKFTKCLVCGETGASVFCYTKKCHAAFHFSCAYRNNKIAFLRSKETYCDTCSKYRGFKVGYLSEYSTKRRFQVAKNQQPWNMTMISQPNNGIGNQSLMGQLNFASLQNVQDIEKPLQIEKWRPYYYDMFNRVGNLTVLSLRKEINQIIKDSMSSAKQQLDSQLTDFSTMRIYWKFYGDSMMQIEEDKSNDPINMQKSHFLYSNNQVREVIKNDLQTLLPYVSDKIKDKVQLGIHYNQAKIQPDDEKHIMANPINQTNFWQKIMQHFQKERPNFTLQNIIFSISEFGGKTKYPISIWNRAEVKNKSFFLKNGSQVLATQSANSERENQGNLMSTKKNDGLTLDDVFKRMMKINQMGENQNPMTSVKRMTSSKHMPYEAVLQNLGKKMFYKGHQDEDHHKHPNPAKLQKKIRQTDTIDNTNKEIDLPIAMKYRLSKQQAKRVEVGPSKIHRNGLFTLEDLMPGDIVIEYVGEKIRNKVADKREIIYEQKGIGDCYLFRLDKEYIIDATFHGNKARYLNHSCDANCSAKIINVQGQKHIIISANRGIKSGEELTYNYNFDYEADKLDCFCGAPGCLGRLN